MSDAADRVTPCARVERDGELGRTPQLIVELLTDDDARETCLFLEDPATVREVSEEFDLLLSTTPYCDR